jgi:hypothetical protein
VQADGPIRVGLAGLTTEQTSVTKSLILPRPNIAAAAREIIQFAAGYDTNQRPDPAPMFFAGVVYCGSWEQSDWAFPTPF